MHVIRARGYAATTIDELCVAAGVTKGAFFHHFPSKEALGVAAVQHWATTTGELFAHADYHAVREPLNRVLAYLDLRTQLIEQTDGDPAAYTCLAGTMAQETYLTSPAIRDATGTCILGHAHTLEADFEAVIAAHPTASGVTAESLAVLTQTVLQGAFVVSKAADDPSLVTDAIGHLRRYLVHLFSPAGAPPSEGASR